MDDAVHRQIATRIRALAKERKVALTHLADRAGVSRAQLWNVLSCKRSPTIAWLLRVCAALDVELIDVLIEGPEPRRGESKRR